MRKILQFGWWRANSSSRKGEHTKVMLMADRDATASAPPMQAKVLHEASLSLAAAGTQLDSTAQTWTLPGETALAEPEETSASSHTQHMPAESCHSPAAQPRMHRRDLQLTAEWTSCFLKWHMAALFGTCLPCSRIQAEPKFH